MDVGGADATGYENIKLIASLYNWPSEKYQELVREIEDFTELGGLPVAPDPHLFGRHAGTNSHLRSPPRKFRTFCWSMKASARATRSSRRRRRARVQQFVSRAQDFAAGVAFAGLVPLDVQQGTGAVQGRGSISSATSKRAFLPVYAGLT